MNKTIQFSLHKFGTIPNLLRLMPGINKAAEEFTIDLARLYHHYYTDSYGVTPPNPNHANFEYLQFLSSCSDFRFINDGLGASTGKKRNLSSELGQAFCRYFLYEFCGITYFAHMDKVLDKPPHPAFEGITIKRKAPGDVPDYLCAKKSYEPFIGEAKGSYSSISFTNATFGEWRKQFDRIGVKDKFGINKKVKGYIVATKYVTELNRASNKAKVFAEDPETEGDSAIGDNSIGLQRGCMALHYSRLLSKLGLSLLSSSLEQGFVVPGELSFNLPVWRCRYGPLNGIEFVGGYFADSAIEFSETSNGTVIFSPNILKLGVPFPMFYGIQASTLKVLRKACLGGWDALSEIEELNDLELKPSNLAWLRDGSITGSLDFFEFVRFETF